MKEFYLLCMCNIEPNGSVPLQVPSLDNFLFSFFFFNVFRSS